MARENPLTRRFGQVIWSLRQRGVGKTLRTVVERAVHARRAQELPTHPFDLEHGTDTSGLIGSRDLRTGHPHDIHSIAYFGTPPSRLRRAVERWREEAGAAPASSTTFIDLGCGKGRALLVASGLGFREVVGVEINPELAATAQRNLEHWRSSHAEASPMSVVRADATELPLPDGPVLLYLYNSFGAPVLRTLLRRLVETRAAVSAPLHLLYLCPEQAAVLDEFPQFERLWTGPIPLDVGEPPDGVSTPEDPCSLYRLRTTAA